MFEDRYRGFRLGTRRIAGQWMFGGARKLKHYFGGARKLKQYFGGARKLKHKLFRKNLEAKFFSGDAHKHNFLYILI